MYLTKTNNPQQNIKAIRNYRFFYEFFVTNSSSLRLINKLKTMVTISETSENFIFKLKGLHFIWALKHELRIPKKNIVKVYQNAEELNKWKGFRFGTYVPGLITAGTFSWKGTTNFWDVCNKKNTIIIELKDSIYNKLYLEVTDVNNATKILTQ